jgi:hypothetical protein
MKKALSVGRRRPERTESREDGGVSDLDVWLASGYAFLILVGLIAWASEPTWRPIVMAAG